MESMKGLKNIQIIILGVCIAAATVISSVILSQGFLKVMKFSREVITVTGSAQKEIKSDYIIWRCSFSRRQPELVAAYQALEKDLVVVKNYLISKGVGENEMVISPVSTDLIYRKSPKGADTNDVEAYRLSRNIEIRSSDVDKITVLSRQSTELINSGLEFQSYSPDYFYAKLDELKVEMLARATENAKQRASNMAAATGNRIGFMRSAKMGVFQITPLNSTEVSDYGVNDTSSLEKKVTAVVNVSFAIE